MKKFIFFLIGMLMMLSLGAMTAQSTSPAMDNKASPPEINTSSNYHPFLVMAIVEIVPAPLITWGYNNVMTSDETSAQIIIPVSTRIQRFLGPGDRLASAMLGGQSVLSTNDDNAFTNLYFAATELKNFLGPGDSCMLGYTELNTLRRFAFQDYAFDPSRKIGGHRIV